MPEYDTSPHRDAAMVLRRLGPAILAASRVPGRMDAVTHLPRVIPPHTAATLPLPLDDELSEQTAALVDTGGFYRSANPAVRAAAYASRPRTAVYESLETRPDGGWVGLVAVHLGSLIGCRVVSTLYASRTGDHNLGPHDDAWWGAIVQMRGTKRWQIASKSADPYEITTNAGDVLFLPAGVPHAVTTPSTPGHSVHLVLAVITEHPFESASQEPALRAVVPTARGHGEVT